MPISLTGSTYTENFDSLSNTAASTTNVLAIVGWEITESGGGARDNEQYAVDTGASNAGDIYSYGSAASTERALGGLRSGTLIPVIGASFTNNTGATITSLQISYRGEQWRLGTASRSDRLDFQYSFDATSVSTGTWTDFDALDFSTPNTATTGAKDGNATGNNTTVSGTISSLNIANGATFYIRYTDFDATGADDGLAIDDFSLTATTSGGGATPTVTIAAQDAAAAEAGTDPGTFRITRTGDTTSPLTVNYTITGQATGVDYTENLTGAATIAAGQSFVDITITPVDDALVEGSETVTLTLTSNANYTLGASGTEIATVAIADNDISATPTVNLSVSLNAGTEAGTTLITVTATSSSAVSGDQTVNLGVTGTGITTGDYTLSNSVITIANGQTTGSVTFTVVDDAVVEGTETATLTISSPTAGISLGTTTTQNIAITDNDVAITKISTIQGAGTTAALTGTQTIEGIVTRVFAGSTKLNGFYVQEEDADSDGNATTSEAIFVFDPSGLFTGNAGDKVRITGTVTEFTSSGSSLTQLTSLTNVTNLGASTLPTVTNVQLPTTSATDLERYEGMLVNISALTGNLTVTENFQLGRFGQVILAVDGASNQAGTDARLDQYTQFNAPSVSGYAAYLADIAKRRIYLDDGSGSQNVDPTLFGRGGNPLSATNTLRSGDTVANITGVLDERFEGYRIQTSTGVNFTATNARPVTPPSVGGTLKVASFNVLNYFNGDGTGSTTGFNTTEQRGADSLTEFNRQRGKTFQSIINSGADVIGLMEIENDGYGSTSAIQDLVNGLNAIAGAGTYSFINPGTSLGSDAIAVGLIYKSSKVTPVGAAAAIPNGFNNGAFDLVGRKPLAQTFQQNSNGEQFTTVVNHFKSKGSSSGGVGDADAGDGQGFSNGTRTRQAQDLATWLATKPTGSNDADYLILGDLNAYAQEDPITTLGTAGYGNLLPNTSYSYVFDGQLGALDHALGSASLSAQVTGAEKWHINADEPTVLDYNTEFKTANQISSLYSADQFRSSDHDPVLVGLNLSSAIAPTNLSLSATSINENVAVNNVNNVIGTFSTTDSTVNDTFTYSFVNGVNDNAAFSINANQLLINASPNFEAKSVYNILVRTTDQGGLSYDKALTINIINVNEAPSITAAAFSIEENSVFNTLIGQVVASDPDANDKITFGITSGNTDINGNGKTPFAIDRNTGEIKVNDPSDLNFEKNLSFNLGITATDAGGLSAQSVFAVNRKNVVKPATFSRGDSDVFTLSSGDKPKPALLFTVNGNNAKQTGEIGVFIVDDAAGTIDGIAPNQSGYAEKALSKAKVLFSTIDSLPSGFSTSGLSRLLQFSDTARIRFYTINDKSATTDSVLNSKAYDKVNFSPIKDLSLTDLAGGFSLNFNGLDISIKPSDDALAIGTALQDKTEGEVLDLTQGFDTTAFSQVKAEFIVNRDAAFNNFVGFYKIENAKGDIKKADGSIVSVGQSGYTQAAIAGQIPGIDLTVANQSTQTSSGILQAGSIFAPFIVINANPSAILDNNPNNDPAVYFSFLGANTDKVDHVRLLGNNTFAFEDLPNGGDFDYNDIIVKVNLTPVA